MWGQQCLALGKRLSETSSIPSPPQSLGFQPPVALRATFLATSHPVGLGLAFLPRAHTSSQQELFRVWKQEGQWLCGGVGGPPALGG